MGQRLAAFTLLSLSVTVLAWPADHGVKTPMAKATLAFFESHTSETPDALLAHIRPDPLDPASRAQVVASLPKDELQPTQSELEKIEAASRILDYSARNGAITLRVIDLDYAFIGLYYRTVILVSRPQLAILNADEFAALVAHEVGHDYDWNAYWTAIQGKDHARRRELELRADGLAVVTLRGMGLDPERLVTAVQRTMLHNRGKDPVNQEDYVSLDERVAFIRAIAHMSWPGSSPTAVERSANGPRN
jgi:Zn-dependent protease with chaperone function